MPGPSDSAASARMRPQYWSQPWSLAPSCGLEGGELTCREHAVPADALNNPRIVRQAAWRIREPAIEAMVSRPPNDSAHQLRATGPPLRILRSAVRHRWPGLQWRSE